MLLEDAEDLLPELRQLIAVQTGRDPDEISEDELRSHLSTLVQELRDEIEAESVPAAFHERARQAPDRMALVEGEVSVTYGELQARVDAIARAVARGASPRSLVAISMEPGIARIAAALGALEAGAAFIVVPPDAPPAEKARMR